MNIETYIAISNCKTAFGTLAVLDNVAIEDLEAVLDFAKIVSNYLKMKSVS